MLVKASRSLAFPVGRMAGVDPSHPATNYCVVSSTVIGCVPTALVPYAQAVASFTPSFVIDAALGPAIQPSTSNNNGPNGYKFSATTALNSDFTAAAIFRPLSISGGSNFYLIAAGASGVNGGGLIGVNSTGVLQVHVSGANNIATGLAVAANIPYFAAVSFKNGAQWAAVLLNLASGALKYASGTTALTQSVAGTNIGIGYAFGSSGINFGGNLSATNYTAAFLSLSQLMAWAEDPWSYWFPRRTLQIVGVAAVGSFKPAWARRSSQIISGGIAA